MNNYKKGERFKIYTKYLNIEQSVTIKAFLLYATSLGIPEITARRDLKLLENLNYITIEMGLVKYNHLKARETTRLEKTLDNREEKNQIAKTAVGLIGADEIFVGPGTTCEAFVRHINKPIRHLYTNGFEIAKIAENNEYINRVIVIGGKLRPQSGAMCGPIATKTIDTLRFAQAFITITNINTHLDLFNNNEDEAFLTAQVIENSIQSVCMIDTTKLQPDSHGNIIKNAKEIQFFVFESKPETEWYEKFKIISEIKW